MSISHRYAPPKPRGPQRLRWERKRSSFSVSSLLTIVATLLFTILGTYTLWGETEPTAEAITSRHSIRGRNSRDSFFDIEPVVDAIVVGSGLAGLAAALTILDRGGTVLILEKEPILGGNSNKASSGMNACCLKEDNNNDSTQLFYEDTVRSAGEVADLDLIGTLVDNSAPALTWIQNRVGVDLSVLVQLGGHSRRRTHRPHVGFVGAEIMNAMQEAVRRFEANGSVEIETENKVSRIVHDHHGQVMGVVAKNHGGKDRKYRSNNVVLATGGFASDRSSGSLLEKYRPELMQMAATAGPFSTGDGVLLAEGLGAGTRDMEKVQIHPTGFVSPSEPHSQNKVLAAELLRGVGGLLINRDGQRFCNELGTRAYVSDKMLEHDSEYAQTRKWNPKTTIPTFHLVLSSEAAKEAEKHVDVYSHSGLMTKVEGLSMLSRHLGVQSSTVEATFREYHAAARMGEDAFGKINFRGIPPENLETEVFYVGEVTPVLHYCMGGIKIDTAGNVLHENGTCIPGLYAAGEVTGGVHGSNRLGGNSLLECAVFGSIVGSHIPIRKDGPKLKVPNAENETADASVQEDKEFSAEEIARHNKAEDCFVGLHGKVYDLTTFLTHHPGGKGTIESRCGAEATAIFAGVHSQSILSQLTKHLVGHQDDALAQAQDEVVDHKVITVTELSKHNSPDDCWVVLHGLVYDLTEFSKQHPGGSYIIQKLASKDGTSSFEVFHPKEKLSMVQDAIVGKVESQG